MDTLNTEKLDMANLDWSSIDYGSGHASFMWRIFLWILTILAICGMAAVLFWWQINRGVIPNSTFSTAEIVRSSAQILPMDNASDTRTGEGETRPDGENFFPTPHPSGRYMVLAGSFINEENAKRIFEKLTRTNIPVRAKQATINGQRHTHLLVGPYLEQETARTAVSLIRQRTGLPVDYTSVEVEGGMHEGATLPPSIPGFAEDPATLLPGHFVVLAGSFTDRLQAEKVQARLQNKEIASTIKEVHSQDRTFFHVVVGPYRLAIQANAMVDTIQNKTGILAESSQIL